MPIVLEKQRLEQSDDVVKQSLAYGRGSPPCRSAGHAGVNNGAKMIVIVRRCPKIAYYSFEYDIICLLRLDSFKSPRLNLVFGSNLGVSPYRTPRN